MIINDGFQNVVAGLSPARDKAMNVSYAKSIWTTQQLEAVYADSPAAKASIDQIPDDSFRKWRTWQGEDDQVNAIETLEKKLKIKQTLNWVDKMSRLYGEYYAYMDVGQPPELPLDPETVGKDGLRFVIPMSPSQLVAGDYETDPMSPEYGRPKYYTVSSNTQGIVNIHPSRVIRMFGTETPSQGFGFQKGESVLQYLMTSVMQYDGVMANVASLVYEAKIDIIQYPGLSQVLDGGEQETAFLKAQNLAMLMKGNNGVLLLEGATSKDGVGAVYSQKTMSFATLPDLINQFQAQLAGAASSNRSRMFGVSAGGLGSNGNLELSTYYDFVNSRQTNYLEPAIALLDECIIRSALGDRPDDLWYEWNSLWQISDKERADIGAQLANAAKTLSDANILPAEVLSEPVTLALVNAGVFPGLDQKLNDFLDAGGEIDPEPEVIEVAPPGAANHAPVVKDELPEDPTLQLLTDYLMGAK
jgi:phage-related protein (TIGR01555 family)